MVEEKFLSAAGPEELIAPTVHDLERVNLDPFTRSPYASVPYGDAVAWHKSLLATAKAAHETFSGVVPFRSNRVLSLKELGEAMASQAQAGQSELDKKVAQRDFWGTMAKGTAGISLGSAAVALGAAMTGSPSLAGDLFVTGIAALLTLSCLAERHERAKPIEEAKSGLESLRAHSQAIQEWDRQLSGLADPPAAKVDLEAAQSSARGSVLRMGRTALDESFLVAAAGESGYPSVSDLLRANLDDYGSSVYPGKSPKEARALHADLLRQAEAAQTRYAQLRPFGAPANLSLAGLTQALSSQLKQSAATADECRAQKSLCGKGALASLALLGTGAAASLSLGFSLGQGAAAICLGAAGYGFMLTLVCAPAYAAESEDLKKYDQEVAEVKASLDAIEGWKTRLTIQGNSLAR